MLLRNGSRFIVSTALAGMSFAAVGADSVLIYGKIDTDVEYQRAGGKSVAQMVDNASRWGMRGTETLNSELSAAFGIEYGFNADSGLGTSPDLRNSYVGMISKTFGALALGRLDSGAISGSPIYTQNSGIVDYVIHDAGTTAIGTKVLNGRNRVSNAVGYRSPEFGGLSMKARMNLAGPDPAVSSTTSPIQSEDDIRAYDVALDYASKNITLGVGYSRDSRTGGLASNNFRDKVQTGAAYTYNDQYSVYGIVGRDRYAPGTTTRGNVLYWLAGASTQQGPHKIMINYMERQVQSDRQGTLKKIQAGYRYSLSKRTAPYIFFDREDPNSNLHGNIITTVGAGIVHSF